MSMVVNNVGASVSSEVSELSDSHCILVFVWMRLLCFKKGPMFFPVPYVKFVGRCFFTKYCL